MFKPAQNEVDAVKKLREALVDISDWEDLDNDGYIVRWLRSKDMDFEKTKQGLLEENGMDTILKDYTPDPELLQIANYEIAGHDKDGCPVITYVVEPHDPKKIIKKFGKEALIKFSDYTIEKLSQACRDKQTKDHPIQQIIFIVDAKKFSFKQLTSPGATELALDQLQRALPHYPDILKLGVVVNAPKVAKIAYKIAKPFVPDRIIKQVKLYPKCNAKVKKFLLQYIDASELPQKYGGNKKVGEAADLSHLNDDEDCSGNPDDMEEAEDMIETKVGSGKKLKLEYQVDQPKTQICWSFQTDDREIGFTVYYGEKEEILMPYEKFGSLALQNNSITCEKVGKYTLCFNNKEMFRSVTMSYIVSVFPPEADDE